MAGYNEMIITADGPVFADGGGGKDASASATAEGTYDVAVSTAEMNIIDGADEPLPEIETASLHIDTGHIYVDLLSGTAEDKTGEVIRRHMSILKDHGYTESELQDMYVAPNPVRESFRRKKHHSGVGAGALRVPLDMLVRTRKPEWFLGAIDRNSAQKLLMTKVTGSFVIRNSRKEGHYAMTVKCANSSRGNPVFWHGLISPTTGSSSSGGGGGGGGKEEDVSYYLNDSNVSAPTVDDIVVRCVCSHSLAKSAGIPEPLVLPGDFKPPKVQVKKIAQKRNHRRRGFEGARESASGGGGGGEALSHAAAEAEDEEEFLDIDNTETTDDVPLPPPRSGSIDGTTGAAAPALPPRPGHTFQVRVKQRRRAAASIGEDCAELVVPPPSSLGPLPAPPSSSSSSTLGPLPLRPSSSMGALPVPPARGGRTSGSGSGGGGANGGLALPGSNVPPPRPSSPKPPRTKQRPPVLPPR